MKIAICYLTCISNDYDFNFQHLLNHIKGQTKHSVDLYKYINNENIDYEVNDNEITFSYDYITKQFNYSFRLKNGNSPVGDLSGLQIFPLLDLMKKHPEYDYYMFYEDDVLLNTDKNLFDNLDFTNKIILQNERIYNDLWWWYRGYKLNNVLHYLDPYSGLLNIYLVSKDILIYFIYTILNRGYYGHHELLFNGFVMKFYQNKISYLSDIYNLKCTVYDYQLDNESHEITHPVKTKEQYDKLISNNII